METTKKPRGVAGIVLGVIGVLLCLCLFFVYAFLLAFAPAVAFIPLIPVALVVLLGLILAVYSLKKAGQKKGHIIGTVLNSLCVAVVIAGLITQQVVYWYNKPSGIADPLSNINQLVQKGDNWRQIVQDRTMFELGETGTEPFGSFGTFPAIDGSTVLIPMAADFVWQFTDIDDVNYTVPSERLFEWETLNNTVDFLNFSTTSKAYQKLIFGEEKTGRIIIRDDDLYTKNHYHFSKSRPDIVLATSPSADELQMAANAKVELIVEPIAYDSFVFITHKDNPVNSLTVEQIQGIYSGKITNWRQVGGKNEKIAAYQREPNSGSQTAMEQMVMAGKTIKKPPQSRVIRGMGSLVEVVAGYENRTNSLGYTFKYYVDRLYTHPDIKIIDINGIIPSDDNVRNNSYPFVAPYNAVIRATDINAVGGKFMQWIFSDEGQACIKQAGYVTLRKILQEQ
ncbi:MAG: substrate-binding domain-containing protein [Firmicutes bacterium]|nr:substrate-binding domain-containing protein [Bacillota bacterium]